MQTNRLEILSPAGNINTLKSAIINGADAVYIGGKSFSARKNAVNFTDEEIIEAVRFAHLYGSKVYVTVNTLLHDFELEDVFEFIKSLYHANVDALIVQDLSVARIVKDYFPDFAIHASTQMTIHNIEGAKKAKEIGFDRVVLSRELSFDEIKKIHENVDIELEVFSHGALCMSYSGQCLMSSFIGCRSGNRGACAQPCRLPYSFYDSDGKLLVKNKYILSLKDLCLIDEIGTLKNCGVTSLKIEGRMKSAEYVSTVTSMYNKYRNGGEVSKNDKKILENIFSRSGFTKGYITNNTGRSMLNFNSDNDNVYSVIDDKVHSYAKSLIEKKPEKIKFDAKVYAKAGEFVKAEFFSNGKRVYVIGNTPAQEAINVPLDYERLLSQMKKSGNTPFELNNLSFDGDENISVPIKEINEIRRKGLLLLEDEIIKDRETERKNPDKIFKKEKFTKSEKTLEDISFNAEIRTLIQAKAAEKAGFDRLFVPYELYAENKKYFDSLNNVTVILPSIAREGFKTENIDVKNVCVSNISQINAFLDKKLCGNFTLNVFNGISLSEHGKMGISEVCLSPELNLRQIDEINDSVAKEITVYGRIPLMTVQNCLVKSAVGKCGCRGEVYYLKDRKGAEFPVFTNKGRCVNTIYNSLPVYVADKLDEIPLHGVCGFRFIFTLETAEEINEIYKNYKNKCPSIHEYTRGHFYRGV